MNNPQKITESIRVDSFDQADFERKERLENELTDPEQAKKNTIKIKKTEK